MNVLALERILQVNHQPEFRLKQIQASVYRDGIFSFLEITSLPKYLRELLQKEISILPFTVEKIIKSKRGDSAKALLKLADGNLIETVLISPKPELWSVCISSQVGCQLGCRFCATGAMGFKRNLTAEEITDQVLFWRQHLRKFRISDLDISACDISNVVYMGMGEPFLNWENVKESLYRLTDENLFGFGARSISVSTSGIPEGIEKFGKEFPQVNLAISLHFADDKMRNEYMPVNRRYKLSELSHALKNYSATHNRKIFIEYVMLDGINDRESDALKLAEFLKSIAKLQLIHVNLIRYNPPAGGQSEELKPSSKIKTQMFKDYLLRNGISATIRKSLGDEIQGACGQLAGK